MALITIVQLSYSRWPTSALKPRLQLLWSSLSTHTHTHNIIYYIVWRILYMIWYREVYIIWVLNGPISGENTKPLQRSDIYIYENSVTAKDTRTRDNLYFFLPTLRHHRRRTTCHSSANRYGTPSIYFCFFLFFSFHPLLLIANLIYREDWGVQKREIAVYCQIELRAQRTAPATTVTVVKEIATQRWLTHVMHRPQLPCHHAAVAPSRISCA